MSDEPYTPTLGTRRPSRGHAGFSIVELVVVLVIASVLATLGAPSMRDFIRNNRVQSHALRLANDIQLARSEAVKRRVRVVLCRSADPTAATPACGGTAYTWTTGYLLFASNNGNNVYDAGDTLIKIGMPATGDVDMRTNAHCNNNLEFNADGTLNETDTARIAVCDLRGGEHGRQIDVPLHGRLKMRRGGAGDVIDCDSPKPRTA